MSTISHLAKRARHYLDPRTQVKAAVHVTERAAHYSDPRVHIEAAQRAARASIRATEGAGKFVERQARKDYIKFNRVTAFIAPVVTPILAFIGELVPVFGLIIGPALSFAGAAIARISDSVALRSQGVTGHENSQRARGKQNRTLKYGLIGSAAGGIASAFGLSLTASDAAVAAPINAANGSQSVESVSIAGAGQDVIPTVPVSAGIKVAETATESAGILGTGITWANIGAVASPLITVTQSVLKTLGIGQPKAAAQPGQGPQLISGGGGDTAGGDAPPDTGFGGGLGELANDLAGLPLPVKLAAAAVGAGVVALAFTKGRKAAA